MELVYNVYAFICVIIVTSFGVLNMWHVTKAFITFLRHIQPLNAPVNLKISDVAQPLAPVALQEAPPITPKTPPCPCKKKVPLGHLIRKEIVDGELYDVWNCVECATDVKIPSTIANL